MTTPAVPLADQIGTAPKPHRPRRITRTTEPPATPPKAPLPARDAEPSDEPAEEEATVVEEPPIDPTATSAVEQPTPPTPSPPALPPMPSAKGRATNTVQKLIRFDADLGTRLEEKAAALDCTQTALVKLAVAYYLDTIDAQPQQ